MNTKKSPLVISITTNKLSLEGTLLVSDTNCVYLDAYKKKSHEQKKMYHQIYRRHENTSEGAR